MSFSPDLIHKFKAIFVVDIDRVILKYIGQTIEIE